MKVVGLCGPSGVGKTTLTVHLIQALRALGQRVSVVKHAHKRFDIDHPGKDSMRVREAGAADVVIANDHRLAVVREFDGPRQLTVQQMLAEVPSTGRPDQWVLVEGFKHAALPKIEVWRGEVHPGAFYPGDPQIVAIATDTPGALPMPTALPVFLLNDAPAIARFLLHDSARYEYPAPGPQGVADEAAAQR